MQNSTISFILLTLERYENTQFAIREFRKADESIEYFLLIFQIPNNKLISTFFRNYLHHTINLV